MKSKRRYMYMIACLAIVTIVLTSMAYTFSVHYSKKKITKCDDENINRIHATYAIDTSRMSDVVADADYCFVGNVERIIGTVYKHSRKINGEVVSLPYTKYRVKVIKNIKGQLIEGKTIEVMKAGGREQNSSKYTIYEQDNLPNVKGNYIFSTYVQKNGSLLASGSNSTIRVNGKYYKSYTYEVMCKNKNKKLSRSRRKYKINNKMVYKTY